MLSAAHSCSVIETVCRQFRTDVHTAIMIDALLKEPWPGRPGSWPIADRDQFHGRFLPGPSLVWIDHDSATC